MKRLKTIAAGLLFALVGLRAAAQPITLETKWNQKTFSISTTGVTSLTIDVAGYGSAGYNLLGAVRTLNGLDGTVYGSTAATTTSDVNVTGFSWAALAQGADGTMQMTQTIKTPPARGSANASSSAFNSPFPDANNFSVPLISTSSTQRLPSGVGLSDRFSAQVTNPIFYFTNLTSAATLHFTLIYGVPKVQ